MILPPPPSFLLIRPFFFYPLVSLANLSSLYSEPSLQVCFLSTIDFYSFPFLTSPTIFISPRFQWQFGVSLHKNFSLSLSSLYYSDNLPSKQSPALKTMASWVVQAIDTSTSSSWRLLQIAVIPLVSTTKLAISATSFTIVDPIVNSFQVVGHSIAQPTVFLLSTFGIQNVTYEQLNFFLKTLYQYVSVAVLFGIIVGVATGFSLNTVSYVLTPSPLKDKYPVKSKREKATQHNSAIMDFNQPRLFLLEERKLQQQIKLEHHPKLETVVPSIGSSGVKIYETEGWPDSSTKREKSGP